MSNWATKPFPITSRVPPDSPDPYISEQASLPTLTQKTGRAPGMQDMGFAHHVVSEKGRRRGCLMALFIAHLPSNSAGPLTAVGFSLQGPWTLPWSLPPTAGHQAGVEELPIPFQRSDGQSFQSQPMV